MQIAVSSIGKSNNSSPNSMRFPRNGNMSLWLARKVVRQELNFSGGGGVGGWGGYFFRNLFCFVLGFFFVSVVPAHVWCLLLFSLVLLAGFCFLLFAFAPCFLLPSFCFCCFCFLLSALYRFCFLLVAFGVSCFCFLLFAFCVLLFAFMCFGQKATTVATKLFL